MTKKRKAKKPVGTTGITRISSEDASYVAEFRRVDFPEDKEAIEELVVKGFLDSAVEILPKLAIPPYIQNKQDDFDFELKLADGGSRNLELKEIVRLSGGSYETAASSYVVHEYVTNIRHTILKQSSRYAGSTGSGLFLLLYVTDWRFLLSESVKLSIRYWALRDDHCFQRIYLYHVRDGQGGFAEVLYPESVPANFNPDSVRNNRVRNGDPTKWTAISTGGIGIKFDED